MEKLINNEIAKFLIILGAGTVALTILLSKLIGKVKGAFQPYKKATIYYIITEILLFGAIALLAHPSFLLKPFTLFVLFQAYFLLLGCAHLYFSRENLKWTGSEKTFWLEVLFTVVVCLYGCMAFVFVYEWFNADGMHFMMAASILMFMIPFFITHTFKKSASIPPKIYKEWFYPVNQEVEEPDDSQMKNLLLISFEFPKRNDDADMTNFRVRVPKDMEFGQLFYYFINDYNERHPDSMIQYVNGSKEPHGWIFYKKSKWHTILTNYIDAEKSIYYNQLKENDVIICVRVLQ
jgi:hypothetical protein